MGWKYEPPAPDTEAANMLSAYKERLRGAELHDHLEVNLDTGPPAARRRLLNSLSLFFTRLLRVRRASDRHSAP